MKIIKKPDLISLDSGVLFPVLILNSSMILFANEALRIAAGYDAKEMPVVSPDDLIVREGAEGLWEILESTESRRLVGQTEEHYGRFQMQSKDGLRRWFAYTAQVIEFYSEGYLMISMVDITDHTEDSVSVAARYSGLSYFLKIVDEGNPYAERLLPHLAEAIKIGVRNAGFASVLRRVRLREGEVASDHRTNMTDEFEIGSSRGFDEIWADNFKLSEYETFLMKHHRRTANRALTERWTYNNLLPAVETDFLKRGENYQVVGSDMEVYSVRSRVAVPVIHDGVLLYVLAADSVDEDAFGEEDLLYLQSLVKIVNQIL